MRLNVSTCGPIALFLNGAAAIGEFLGGTSVTVPETVDVNGNPQHSRTHMSQKSPSTTEQTIIYIIAQASATTKTNTIGTTSSSTTEPAADLQTGGSSSSSPGLSTGAIAGIAVGCGIVALLIIGALIYFLVFRRRANSSIGHHSAGYASNDMMAADKEMPAHISDSPQSAYDADGDRLHDRSSMTMAAVGHEHEHGDAAGGFVPYSDHEQVPVSASSAAAIVTGANSQTDLHAAGTRSPSSLEQRRYAHMVEEGMTEDEIRRMVEEERQLDVAIEDAGRHSRAA